MLKINEDLAIKALEDYIKSEGSQAKASKKLAFSQAYMSEVIRRQQTMSDKLAAAIGWDKKIVFEKIEK